MRRPGPSCHFLGDEDGLFWRVFETLGEEACLQSDEDDEWKFGAVDDEVDDEVSTSDR